MKFLSRLGAYLAHRFRRSRDERLDQAVRWAVDMVEPRLRQMPGYPDRYEPAVARALGHCEELAQRMQPPLPVDRSAFTRNPVARALFATTEDIPEVLSRSRAVRDWLSGREADEFVAMMGVRLREKALFGPALAEGEVRLDVAQRVLVFSDHTFTALAGDEDQARALLAQEFLASLLEQVKARLAGLRVERQRLDQERHHLQSMLRETQEAALRDALAACLRELGAVSSALDLGRYGEHMDAVLMEPEQHIGLQPLTVTVDDAGVCHVGKSGGELREVPLCELAGRDRRRWLVTLVRVERKELAVQPDFSERLREADRWLSI
jgi:hypothetical protein